MSYDLKLIDPVTKETLTLDTPHHMKGGTFQVGGTELAELNITYNYSAIFNDLLGEKGIRFLYGKTGADSIPILIEIIELLEDNATSNYWEATEGNAKRALYNLLALAKMLPHGVWEGD